MKKWILLTSGLALIVAVGCSKDADKKSSASASGIDGSKYLLTTEPTDAVGVIEARADSKDEDDVVIVGRIGGRENPWIKGQAAFTIVDPSLKSCADIGSDDCPKPWDY